MTDKAIIIDESWFEQLKDEFSADYFLKLKEFLLNEQTKHVVYPPDSQIFNAFNFTPFSKVKVVILGQDPYHGLGQSHGLCFSVPAGIKPPPSLVNIYKELQQDSGFKIPKHGNLEQWAEQGVFLLNATLTVRANTAGSHQKKGWEVFTNKVISILSAERENLVFVLWGKYAAAKEPLIDSSKHLILKAAHPSPLSAYNGFFGCNHFSKINQYLISIAETPIDWTLKPIIPQLF